MLILLLKIATLCTAPNLSTHVPMTLITSGAANKVGRFYPCRATFTAEQPVQAKVLPPLTKPTFSVLDFQKRKIAMVLDEQKSGYKLIVDSNGNGDLTDDAPSDWKSSQYGNSDGRQFTLFRGFANINLQVDGVAKNVSLGVYKFDRSDPAHEDRLDDVLYYSDYAAEGSVAFGGKSHRCYLVDWYATGFTPQAPRLRREAVDSGMRLAIDINDNGTIDPRGEMFDTNEPFNIEGTSYRIVKLSTSGFDFEKSPIKADKVPLPPVLGDKVPKFTARPIKGAPIKFPDAYKGKILMVFFWALTDEFSSKEIPGLVKTYEKFHGKGFDVLAVNADQPDAAMGLAQTIADTRMTWPTVSEHYRIRDDIINIFMVRFLPAAFLVDGDTGKIIATVENLRGDKLAPTIEKALAVKKRNK